jgi:hypothetical protein
MHQRDIAGTVPVSDRYPQYLAGTVPVPDRYQRGTVFQSLSFFTRFFTLFGALSKLYPKFQKLNPQSCKINFCFESFLKTIRNQIDKINDKMMSKKTTN